MVRFSCFQAHTHSHKPKRRVQLSTETMHKTLEDTSKNQATNMTYLAAESNPHLKEETHTPASNADHATDSFLTERECRSEEMEIKYNTDSDIADHKNTQIKKSFSLGSRLNWKGKSSDVGDSDDQKEQKNYSDGSVNLSGTNNHHELSDHYPEPLLSDSVMVNPDFAKQESLFSIGDPQVLEKGDSDVEGIHSSGAGGFAERSPPRTPHVFAKSLSMPSLNSPDRIATSFLPFSRSSDDLHALDSINKGIMYEVGRQMKGHDSTSNNEKTNGENPIDDAYGTYNYVDSAKDWIIPASDQRLEQNVGGKTSFHQWDEIPAKDFRLKRIEEWVSDLQHCSPLEEFSELASDEYESPKSTELLESSTASKFDVNINPGTEAAKRYISSLNASATAAQLTNLGLVVIPFLCAFGSLKALNLSGNAIVRITAGALPRGLHVLNLSKNSISVIEGLRELTRLRVLDLSYNRILRIGHGLAGCSSLKELYLAGNKISEVEGLHRLLKLNVLDLRFNKISTAKCLGQLASNYNCLQALSLEGNPAQKNVGDDQLKKYVQSLLPHITYYNRHSVKVGGTTMKDTSDRSSRLGIGAHQTDRGLRVEAKSARKGIVAQKVSSSSTHGRKSQVVSSQKASSRSRHVRLLPGGVKTAVLGPPIADFSSRVSSLRNGFLFHRSRSEGTLAAL